MTDDDAEIAAYRQKIDDIDDKIIALLIERTGVVSRVGEVKHKSAPGKCPIRPGREAEMVRRITAKFEGAPFLPAAAAAIWRIIIGMSTAVEAPLGLSVYTADKDNDLYWLAREYFGAFAHVTRQPHVNRVIGDVMDGKAAVGIVPMLRGADTNNWWTSLMQQGSDAPKIFARIPFVYPEAPGKDAPSALAIARIAPEASDEDCSLLVLEADQNVSQNRLQTAFSTAKLEATWINVATIQPKSRHHLIEIKGFVTPGHKDMESLLAGLGASILNVSFLGAYAVPVMFNVKNKSHAANAAKA